MAQQAEQVPFFDGEAYREPRADRHTFKLLAVSGIPSVDVTGAEVILQDGDRVTVQIEGLVTRIGYERVPEKQKKDDVVLPLRAGAQRVRWAGIEVDGGTITSPS